MYNDPWVICNSNAMVQRFAFAESHEISSFLSRSYFSDCYEGAGILYTSNQALIALSSTAIDSSVGSLQDFACFRSASATFLVRFYEGLPTSCILLACNLKPSISQIGLNAGEIPGDGVRLCLV